MEKVKHTPALELEEIDPGILDQVIRHLLAKERAPDREAAISQRLDQSAELHEWATMITSIPADYGMGILPAIYTAISVGLEIGYELGQRQP